MESHLEARLWNDVFVARPGRARHPAGHDPRDRADRDLPGRVRDGGDPLRAARALGRAQRRPLGLHVQRDQEVPHPGHGLPAARPQRGDDDRAVHARLHRAAGAHLPQARRARDRRHGGLHPEPATTEVNEAALAKVREDKTREAGDGFDGSWVAHPDLVPTVPGGLRRGARRPAQPARPHARGRRRHGRRAARRRRPRRATVTEAGCATTSAWASSTSRPGCAAPARSAINNLMEDAATAEISRSQVWQWLHNGVELDRRGEHGHPRAGRAADRRGAGRDPRGGRRRGLRQGPLGRGRALFTRGGAGRRLRRVPDPARPTSGCREQTATRRPVDRRAGRRAAARAELGRATR